MEAEAEELKKQTEELRKRRAGLDIELNQEVLGQTGLKFIIEESEGVFSNYDKSTQQSFGTKDLEVAVGIGLTPEKMDLEDKEIIKEGVPKYSMFPPIKKTDQKVKLSDENTKIAAQTIEEHST